MIKQISSKQSKNKLLLALFIIVLTFSACTDDDTILEQSPSIKIVNNLSENHYSVKSFYLVGYEFNTLNIPKGDSQTFILNEGMQSGYENINVIVNYGSNYEHRSVSAKINIKQGGITTITLTGRKGCEGCPGHSLKWSH